jgi:hypothetical protein
VEVTCTTLVNIRYGKKKYLLDLTTTCGASSRYFMMTPRGVGRNLEAIEDIYFVGEGVAVWMEGDYAFMCNTKYH